MYLEKSASVALAAVHALNDVPGWLTERLFHTDAVECPWTTTPANDTQCQERLATVVELRSELANCEHPLKKSLHTIGHRGAALVAVEETYRSFQIAIESGAGFIECDASITNNLEFVCRHDVCDLHLTTDILTRPNFADRCSVPFRPAMNGNAAVVSCCTFDFETSELLTLCATAPSGTNPKAAHVGEYLTPPPTYTSNFRTNECHKLVTYKGYMEYAKANEISIIPELKGTWNPDMVSFLEASGLNIEWLAHEFASQMVNAGFSAPLNDKWELAAADGSLGIMQTFDRRVAKIWKEGSYSYLAVEYMWSTSRSRNESQVVCNVIEDCGTGDVVEDLLLMGVELLSPAIPVLLGASGHLLVESQASKDLKEIFNTISSKLKQRPFLGSWSLERSGCMSSNHQHGIHNAVASEGMLGACGWYYDKVFDKAVFGQHEDVLLALDVLFKKVGLTFLFSDFPVSVSMYTNCCADRFSSANPV